MSKLDEMADYAEHHDFAAEMEQGSWEADADADPMITTSVRLPKSLLELGPAQRRRPACTPKCADPPVDRAAPRRR